MDTAITPEGHFICLGKNFRLLRSLTSVLDLSVFLFHLKGKKKICCQAILGELTKGEKKKKEENRRWDVTAIFSQFSPSRTQALFGNLVSWWAANLVLFHRVIPWHMAKSPGPSHCFCEEELIGESLTSALAPCFLAPTSSRSASFMFCKALCSWDHCPASLGFRHKRREQHLAN